MYAEIIWQQGCVGDIIERVFNCRTNNKMKNQVEP